ncbi:MAG: DNA gyrase subunit A [Candidatus Nanoarchaeia archaeon]|nr:DNA gyrase subunit A [Candidatus Nanoarchaeia archaeon]
MEDDDRRIIDVSITKEMKKSYLDYAMSVIVGRAIPDVRDGLKPVHRRIFYSMSELGLNYNKPYKKSARVVGEVLGKYHPHGDTAVYDAMVRMAQDFSLRYKLVNGQGNFGSIDGDSPAAMRYTEVKMDKLTEYMLADIDKETVEFRDNFDGSLKEPEFLPTRIPQLLINGTSGIAVGMATNMVPHNFKEINKAIELFLENEDVEIDEMLKYVRGPDFPTGGIIFKDERLMRMYRTGRGSVTIQSKYHFEEIGKKEAIIVTEIPYQVNKSTLVIQIADLVKNGVVNGISDLRDESNREGIRIVIEIKRDSNAEFVMNNLLKHSALKTSIGIQNLCLVNNTPKVLNLKELIVEFIKHRRLIVVRRTEYELKKALSKAHILEGLIKCLDNIDLAIKLIKESEDANIAKDNLIKNFEIDDEQARAILEMRLQKLTNLETLKLREEFNDLMKLIEELRSILADSKKIDSIIKQELEEIDGMFGDERKSEITTAMGDFNVEELLENKTYVITLTDANYLKRMPLELYQSQHRGGKGISAGDLKKDDFINEVVVADTHDILHFYTNLGKVYSLKTYMIPESSRIAKGKPAINLMKLGPGETITNILKVDKKDFTDENKFVMFATRRGFVKKVNLSHFESIQSNGKIAIGLEDDYLISVKIIDETQDCDIFMTTSLGQAIVYNSTEVRAMGRTAKGVIGIRLAYEDRVVSMGICEKGSCLFTIGENGYGKRTAIEEYRHTHRGGKGIRNLNVTEKTGKVVDVRSVSDEDEILILTKQGKAIRIFSNQMSIIGRSTQGVRLVKLNDGDKISSVYILKI